ncbi:hypothetical protein M8J75_007498 [Diaphorina citri]|nr:hypothetical protein M8J75_007498 [Diaphorina citri]KAI5734343.1 hypothetical protein M8J77_005256 [Diaphorina citri]
MDVTREPFLKILFDLETLSYQDKVISAMDIFLGGIDATATTLAMTLHYLSLDRGLQDRIVSELTSPPPDNTRLIKACIRETLRMSATAGGNARCMQNDVIISGYFVPKGTWVLSLNPVIGTLDSYFDFAHQYRPQRWLRQHRTGESTHKFSESTHNKPQCDSGTNESTQNKPRSTSPTKESTQNKSQCVFDIKQSTQPTESTPRQSAHPFASLPFGFGPRMCPGKLVAEQEMVLYLTEILQTFILEPVDKEPLGMIFRTNRVPDRIINIKCVRR